MASFEEMAAELTSAVHQLRAKRESLKRQIEEEENQCDKIDAELEILIDRRREIEASQVQSRNERQELVCVIKETQQTKQKIIESLRFLGANLKKFKLQDKH